MAVWRKGPLSQLQLMQGRLSGAGMRESQTEGCFASQILPAAGKHGVGLLRGLVGQAGQFFCASCFRFHWHTCLNHLLLENVLLAFFILLCPSLQDPSGPPLAP